MAARNAEPIRITEHDEEPVRGLPGELPAGEHVLWQGAPSVRSLSRRVLHTRKIAIYFAILIVWTGASALSAGQGWSPIIGGAIFTAFGALIAIGLLMLYAYGVKRTTVYTLTNKRLVMKIGVALSISMNIPFTKVVSADFRRHRDGTGDLSLQLDPDGPRIGLYALWPHNRPWHWKSPEPTLRSIPDADTAAMILRDQLMAAHANGVAAGASPVRVGTVDQDASAGAPQGGLMGGASPA